MAWEGDAETLASIIDFVPTLLNACGVRAPADLRGLDLLDRPAMTARKSVFVEAYTHDIADLAYPAKSLVTQVVISGWFKLLIPGTVRFDTGLATAPEAVELLDLESDPLEKKDLAADRTDEVKGLTAVQKAAWRY